MTAPSILRPAWDARTVGPPRLSRFDLVVLSVLLALLSAIGLTLLAGDRVGVKLTRFGPTQDARRTAFVGLQFSEEMDRESVAARFRLEPPVTGELTWTGRTLTFRPSQELTSGTRYTVHLDAGATSEAGRKVLQPHQFGFTVRGSRVAYLAPIDQAVKNLWMVDPLDPSSARQLSQSRLGVLAFDVSPDGGSVVFAERNVAGGADLRRLDLDAEDSFPLASCGDHQCTSPAWSPDGRWIAFERQGSTPSAIPGYARDATRVWLLDLSTPAEPPRPLFDDPQIPTHRAPRWSPDGRRLAVDQPTPGGDRSSPGVLIHDLARKETQFHAAAGSGGGFSADGSAFLLPALQPRAGAMQRVLRRVDLVAGETLEVPLTVDLSSPLQLAPGPRPQEMTLALRQLPGDLRGSQQVYVLDLHANGSPRPLLEDPAYDHTSFRWDASRRWLAMERAAGPRLDAAAPYDARTQVWVYDAETGALTQLASAAFQPRWIR